ncbi:MAG TPA: hypothetical protein VEA99_19910 [Gemmatimonadaceae bacterium]|nr:hypothetical protein [Gemmatimonadaceae bacterium]
MQRHDPETQAQKELRDDQQQAQQRQRKHPDDLAARLGNDASDQNVGPGVTEREVMIPTAYDVKEINRALADDFTDDDLKQIPILPQGAALEQGATYVDLAASPREAFKINAGHHAEEGHYYVPKAKTPYEIWNRLIGRERGTSGVKDETNQ